MKISRRLCCKRKCQSIWIVCTILSSGIYLWFLIPTAIFENAMKKHPRDVFLIHRKAVSNYNLSKAFAADTHALPTGSLPNGCKERRHVIFLRLPKSGSSTTTFIMWKFGLDRNLTFLLENLDEKSISGRLEQRSHYLPDPGKFCDMMALVIKYNSQNFRQYFPTDVVVVAQLREPMSHLHSTIHYQPHAFIRDIIPGPEEEKVSTFLKKPSEYERKYSVGRSLLQNPSSIYLGMSQTIHMDTVQKYINFLDKELDFVIILERFDESLLLLRKALCWPLKSILYKPRNVNVNKPKFSATKEEYTILRKWSMADYALYDHYKDKLDTMIREGGKSFAKELEHFRDVLSRTQRFCSQIKETNSITILHFPASEFSQEFKVTFEFCHFIETGGPDVSKQILEKQRKINFCNQ